MKVDKMFDERNLAQLNVINKLHEMPQLFEQLSLFSKLDIISIREFYAMHRNNLLTAREAGINFFNLGGLMHLFMYDPIYLTKADKTVREKLLDEHFVTTAHYKITMKTLHLEMRVLMHNCSLCVFILSEDLFKEISKTKKDFDPDAPEEEWVAFYESLNWFMKAIRAR